MKVKRLKFKKMEQPIYDNHTIYLQTGLLDEDTIMKVISDGIENYEESNGKISSWLRINVVRNSMGEYQKAIDTYKKGLEIGGINWSINPRTISWTPRLRNA